MNTMEYRGYTAKIQYSDEDGVLFGTILGINDMVTFEGGSIEEVRQSFHEAVDDYLDMCKRYGREPDKVYKGSFNVRISPELHRKAALKAACLGISLNQYIEKAIQQSMLTDSEKVQKASEKLDDAASAAEEISEKLYMASANIWDSQANSAYFKPLCKGDTLKQ